MMGKTKIVFLILIALELITGKVLAAPERPNILLILVDDLRWDSISANGHPFAQTPNIDRIAAEGVNFRDSFVVHSLCSPSRATILTGLHSHQHGVISIHGGLFESPGNYLPQDIPIIPGILKEKGYRTGLVGKWHLGGARPRPEFDEWISFAGQGRYKNPELNVNGRKIKYKGQHMTPLLNEFAVNFIRDQSEKPFFLMLSYKAVHAPFTPTPENLGSYLQAPISPPASWHEDLSDKPDWLSACLALKPPPDNFYYERVARYLETLTAVDEGVELLLAELERQGVLDNTMIILIGDNGIFHGEHGFSDKRLAYDESIRIPLLIRYPAWFEAGEVIADDMALNLDIAKTVLDAAGIPNRYGMEGVSLRKLGKRFHRYSFLYQYHAERNKCFPTLRAMRMRNFKYIVAYDRDAAVFSEELYDLRSDPHETDNLADDPRQAQRLSRFRRELEDLRRQEGDTVAVYPEIR